MKFFQSSWFPVLLGIIIVIVIVNETLFSSPDKPANDLLNDNIIKDEWQAPDINSLPDNEEGKLIHYGRELIVNTSLYLGPKGKIAFLSNGMNCQNCHIDAGAKSFGNSFSQVASTYPKYRDRSGRIESIEFRINECMERSLNGAKLDSLSKEMKAMVAYLKWIGKDVPKGKKPIGSGLEELNFMNRAADTEKGKLVFESKCQSCHGSNGQGALNHDSSFYLYPPLWGSNSYNVSAGLYRISRFASYVKNNMPFGATHSLPKLTDEEAWDVAAFVNSQQRPEKHFSYDWPKIATKPVDYPYGPYADYFSEKQHKYGPFIPIRDALSKMKN
jgi:thiosulfate dehydrogenase